MNDGREARRQCQGKVSEEGRAQDDTCRQRCFLTVQTGACRGSESPAQAPRYTRCPGADRCRVCAFSLLSALIIWTPLNGAILSSSWVLLLGAHTLLNTYCLHDVILEAQRDLHVD